MATPSLPGWDQLPKGAGTGTHWEGEVGQTGEWPDRLSTVGPQTPQVYKHLLTQLHHPHRAHVTDGPTQEPQVSSQGAAGPGTKQGEGTQE